jgi:copper homeostasis protein CutC
MDVNGETGRMLKEAMGSCSNKESNKKAAGIRAENRHRILTNRKQSANHSTATIAECTRTQTNLQQTYSEHTRTGREGDEAAIREYLTISRQKEANSVAKFALHFKSSH